MNAAPMTPPWRAHPERDDEKGGWKADGRRRRRRRTQAADPERVSQLVAGLQRISQDDRNGEPEERRGDRSLKQHSTTVSHERIFPIEDVEGCRRLPAAERALQIRYRPGRRAQCLTTNQENFVGLCGKHLPVQ